MKLKKHYLGHLSQKKISISYFFFLSSLLRISHLMFTPHPHLHIYSSSLFLSHLLLLSLSTITKTSKTPFNNFFLFSIGFQSLPLTLIFFFFFNFHGGSSSPSPATTITTTSPPSSQHHN